MALGIFPPPPPTKRYSYGFIVDLFTTFQLAQLCLRAARIVAVT